MRSILLTALALLLSPHADAADSAWPAISREAKPWTRWWWLGSAVDAKNLTRQLTEMRDAGLGGAEICPIYGVKGAEARELSFLSPPWVAMFAHTTSEAKRLGLGVDLTTGTGWPFGGPSVSDADASSKITLKRYDVTAGAKLTEALPKGTLQCLRAVSDSGEQLDLTANWRDWTAPAGAWRLYAAVQSGPVQKVKRAAPGGAGNVLDPFSPAALDRYLAGFDKALASTEPARAQFHDSFEYFGATWTPELFAEFQKRRGYDLREHLPALAGEGDADTAQRVRTDYCQTLGELHLDYLHHWRDWSHAHGSLVRNQSHGGPGNLLDSYANADIPETEIFREVDEKQIPLLQFAASAAHVAGHRLNSSESFTWLAEHFQATLADAKTAADFLWLGGVNHLFFHGTPYSPADAAWPGWQFYASVNFGAQGGLWRDLTAFTAYIARVQSVLQSGEPDTDLLLYWPQHDSWALPREKGTLVPLFTIHSYDEWLAPTPFYETAQTLWQRGYSADFISDAQLAEAHVVNGQILTAGGHAYRAILLPPVQQMEPATLRQLFALAHAGATIFVQGKLPQDVPGNFQLTQRREALRALTSQNLAAKSLPTAATSTRTPVGAGALIFSGNVDALAEANVHREPMSDLGLRFIRRKMPDGFFYFLVNRSDRAIADWIPLGTPASAATILDPLTGASGSAAIRERKVFLQLQPGQSLILRTFTESADTHPAWHYWEKDGDPVPLTGEWKVEFIEGGPVLPAARTTTALGSWTAMDGMDAMDAKRFAGTARYTLTFAAPATPKAAWQLDLGRVRESARVRLNGHDLGTLWCPPFIVKLDALQPTGNQLEIEVTNLATNRIADLDRRKVPWKIFQEINIVSRDYKPLDATAWPPRDSGLLGPITLHPLRELTPR